jgi:hypothetical protein
MIAMWYLALLVMHMCLCNKQSLDPSDSDRSAGAGSERQSHQTPRHRAAVHVGKKERSTFTSLTYTQQHLLLRIYSLTRPPV